MPILPLAVGGIFLVAFIGLIVWYHVLTSGSSSAAQGSTTFNVTKRATGRYVLIWITDLPPLAGSPGRYETMIYDITARGFTSG